jgi:ADP-heptose:LPS heptosyltransferase
MLGSRARSMTILVSKVNQLGDNVVFLPVVQYLRQALPSARIIVATSPAASELYTRCVPSIELLRHSTSQFNSAWKRPWELAGAWQKWRSARPSLVLLGDDQGNVAQLLAATCGASYSVGPQQDQHVANRLLSHHISLDDGMLIALQNWMLLRAVAELIGLEAPLSPPAPDLRQMIQVQTPSSGIVIHAGASRSYKRWPLERYVALANRLVTQNPVTWVNQHDARTEANLSPDVRRFEPNELSDFVTLLARANLFIGNNSGPMNLASALGVRSVIFNGPSQSTWDPAWHRDQFLLIQDSTLSCQPCDQLTHPVNECRNLAEPMACMKRWSVEVMTQRCLDWMRKDIASA